MLVLVSSSKYLGVTLNDHLTWNDQIQNTVNSANKTIGILRRTIRTKKPYHQRSISFNTSSSNTGVLIPCLEPLHLIKHSYDGNSSSERYGARWNRCIFLSYDSVSDILDERGWRSLEDSCTDSRLCLF